MKRSFKVTLDIPPEATISEVRDYIYEAVYDWRGQCRPPGSHSEDDSGDPCWYINSDTITVTRIRPR